MAVSKRKIEKCLATIEAIVSNDSVDQYVVGFTRKSAITKGDDYRREGFEHLVILEDKMDRVTGLQLETALQQLTMLGEDGAVLTQKYHHEKAGKRTQFRSSGASTADESMKECSVYVAWWCKP
ncbi:MULTISPECIES: hypothetical protein [unclassified Sphingomonas]|uniref:hypothetical protein n=1 Tax=unclassified Sphingomonas TaxID=196159 RepID=UPI0006FD4EF7|nr:MULTISPECIES: hypothetical protein [unclassified Sphingomonas]